MLIPTKPVNHGQVLLPTNRVIISRLSGGLGNQLFNYAVARRLAHVNNAELALDDVSGFAYDKDYRRAYQLHHFRIPCRKATALERLQPFSRIRRYLLRFWNQLKPFEKRTYLIRDFINFDPRLLDLKIRDKVYLDGGWQGEDYFKDIEDILRKELQIIPPTDRANLSMSDQINACIAVAVHVRFFDEANLARSINNAPGEYYTRAIHAIEQLVPTAHYFIFSDQPEVARSRIPLPDNRVTLVRHNGGDAMAYADLWLMSQCQHFIIANSTFSWWGAWLAEGANKHVIAPGIEITSKSRLTSWGFRGLLPKTWILM